MNEFKISISTVVVAVAIFYFFPQKYEGKTAKEWYDQYDQIYGQYEELLGSCSR
jgi:hypothetical protein